MNDHIYEHEAWEAFIAARRDWRRRGAPSVGAMAASLVRNLLYPPSYITRTLAALALYLSEAQRAEREGFNPKRRGLDLNEW